MLRYVIRRLIWGLFTLWSISVLAFIIIQLPPGDFASTYVARLSESGGSQADVDRVRAQFGLDDPGYVQYLNWIEQMLHGDFGRSLSQSRPVAEIIQEDLALTVVVALAAIVITWVIALPIGIYTAVHRYSVGDYIVTFLGFLGLAIPNFLLALVLMYLGFELFGLSVGGLHSPEYETAPWSVGKALDLGQHLIIPAIVLGTSGMAHQMRIMRANLLDELGKPYVITAQAKGLPKWRVIGKYPVRVAMNPFASSIGILLPSVISGTVIVSVVLSLETLGPTLLEALRAQDMFLAGAIVLLLGVLTIVGTLISDLVLMALDPRIRHAG